MKASSLRTGMMTVTKGSFILTRLSLVRPTLAQHPCLAFRRGVWIGPTTESYEPEKPHFQTALPGEGNAAYAAYAAYGFLWLAWQPCPRHS